MAVQDYGFVPLGQGVGNALMGVAALKQRDRALAADEQQNAMMQQRFQAGQDEMTRQREMEQTKALAGMIYEGVRAKEPRAIEASIQILGKVAPMDPQAAEMFRQNPDRLAPALERVFGIQGPPAPLEVQSLPGYGTVVTQGGEFKASRANPAPQQRPTGSWSAPFDAVGADGKPGKFTQHSITGEVRPVNVGGRQIAPVSKPGEEQVQPNPNLKGVTGFEAMPNNVKLTEVQGKNYLGASMMAEHLPVLTDLLKNGYVPSRTDLYAVGPPLKGIGNSAMQEITPRTAANPNANQYFTAGSKILTAILRPESGGAITEDEWTMYGPIYLPWPGDSKEDRARKMASLNEYMKRLAQVSGPASGYFSGGKEEEVIDLPTPR